MGRCASDRRSQVNRSDGSISSGGVTLDGLGYVGIASTVTSKNLKEIFPDVIYFILIHAH